MSKQRYLDTRFWDDSYICDLDPSEKLVYLYLLTNPLTTICGVYEITIKRICNDTGYNRDTVEKILERFARDGKIVYVNGWLALKNFIKYQNTGSDKIRRGIDLALENAPKELAEWVKGDRVAIPYPYLSNYSNSNSNKPKLNTNYTMSGKPDPSPSDFDVKCAAIIEALNYLAETHFRHKAKGTRDLIKARFREGAILKDFEKVIKIKCEQWADDEKMKGYLRPETLFTRNHFESYRNEYELKYGKD